MYNKKCKNTFLFLIALVCLITLILPFMQVGFFGEVNLFLKIIYYFFISIFVICIVSIILIGIISLFKNSFMLIALQEILAYLSLIMLVILLAIFIPNPTAHLTFGFSILALETLVMAVFDDCFILIKKLPKSFRKIKEALSEQKQEKLKKQVLEAQNVQEKNIIEAEIVKTNNLEDDDEVKIIPPDEELI